MEDNKEVPKEQPQELDSIKKEIEALKAEKEQLKANQEAIKKEQEELELLRKEVEELKSYTFPKREEIVLEPATSYDRDIKQLELKFKKLIWAQENLPQGHPQRAGFKIGDTYNGKNLNDGYLEYKNEGKKMEEIFPNYFE